MSKESLQQAVDLAGGQAQLARGIKERMPGSKVGQVHVWGWLNSVKIEVPPADVVLAIADFLEYRMTPHDLRPDLYPNPADALPARVAPACKFHQALADGKLTSREIDGLQAEMLEFFAAGEELLNRARQIAEG